MKKALSMRLSKEERLTEELFSLESEYARMTSALGRVGILKILPRSGSFGVIGIKGEAYPVPTQEELQRIFTSNKALVDRKLRQGFTQLQLTPIGMPVPRLLERVKGAIAEHAAAGRVMQTKQKPNDAAVMAQVNAGKPLWAWETVLKAMDSPEMVYFPQSYKKGDHRGLAKEEVLKNQRLCAVPGWSVGLIEPIPMMPKKGQGRTIGMREQLEAGATPREYLQKLSGNAYEGETGWTQEDFLAHFVTQLDTLDQVSHNRYDGNALWLLGSFMPNKYSGIVPVGYWTRVPGRINMSAHRAGNRLKDWVARSMVRLRA